VKTTLPGKPFNQRFHGLDLLRALAIITVVYVHDPAKGLFIPEPFWDGVDIFFALSGFLIGLILFSDITLARFYTNRWFRTLPLYYLVMTFMIVTYVNVTQWSPKFLFFLQTVPVRDSIFFKESWSLAVEEWVYLLVPLMLRKLKLPTTMMILIATPVVFRFFINDFWLSRTALISRLDAIPYGIMAAYLYLRSPDLFRKYRVAALICGIGLIIVNGLIGQHSNGYFKLFYFSVNPVAYALVLPFFIHVKTEISAAAYIARISYSMYITHVGITKYLIVDRIMKLYPWAPEELLYWFLVFAIAHFLSKHVEYPVMAIRYKWIFKNIGTKKSPAHV
jgi:peptidoglycan/LPS O-acetylase OafA/YrhL